MLYVLGINTYSLCVCSSSGNNIIHSLAHSVCLWILHPL